MDKNELPPDTIFHVGVSGGKDSAAVLLWMVHKSGVPLENINATFCDTGNEHEWTLEQVQLLSERVHPIETITPEKTFYPLVHHKKRFPSSKARFCTQFLKIKPSSDHITELTRTGKTVVAVSGVRADESEDRRLLEEWEYSSALCAIQWRPLITWSIKDVLDIHREFGIPLNPLYSIGAQRVGCFPCIMSRKAEVRMIAQQFPERIAMIREVEEELEMLHGRYSGFFHRNTIPERFRTKEITTNEGEKMMVATIDDVVRWSMTGKRALGSWEDEPEEPRTCISGFCE